nr:MAG TPA_asm: hypothetical protein [Bacteriophage sp.]
MHRIGQLSCEDNDTNEVRLVYDAKYTPEAELALNKYCFETMSLAASLKKGGYLPL